MKIKTLLKALTLAFVVSLAGKNVKAQTVDLSYFADSTFFMNCPTPATLDFNGWGQTTGYTPGVDEITMNIWWGDGTDTTFMVPLSGTSPQWFSFWLQHTYLLPGTYQPLAIATGPGSISDSISYGPVLISNGCGTVEGDFYIDNNSNCVFDAGDDTLHYHPVIITDQATGDTVYYSWTNYDGHYNVNVPSGFNLEITGAQSAGLTISCPVSGSYSFNLAPGASVTHDFGFTCSATQFDLAAYVSGAGFVPGEQHYMHVGANNLTCLSQGGTLTLTLDPLVSYVSTPSSYVAPTSVSGNTVTWTVPPLALGQTYNWWWWQFWSSFKIETDTTAMVGDTVCHTITITPTSGDLDPSNNTYSYCSPVLASYDPNMKQVSPIGIGATGDVDPGTEFTYTVHFQNTGTYPAKDIYIMDTLSQHLDLNTLEILGATHDMDVIDVGNGIFKFEFDDIWLPDSTSDEPNSHGSFVYRITAKSGLAIGTQIENTAHIYFDYNPPVVTNTTLNTIAVVTNIPELTQLDALLFPNPTNDILNVQFNDHTVGLITMRDMTGRTVLTQPVTGVQTSMSTAGVVPGIYTLQLDGQFFGRVIVQR